MLDALGAASGLTYRRCHTGWGESVNQAKNECCAHLRLGEVSQPGVGCGLGWT